MRRILLSTVVVVAAVAFVAIAIGATTTKSNTNQTYKIELDNAFGLVSGGDFKVAGVAAGKVKLLELCYVAKQAHCKNPMDALVTVSLTNNGFGPLRSDTFCQSRPQSLIGEYFIDCEPGLHGQVLKPGSTIPVTQTQSTIPADLIQNVMRMPYRERLTLIINELGAAAASRSDDLQAALQRAVPALTETDNLLNLLANDSNTIQQLNVNANQVIKALADGSGQVNRFIDEANNLSTDTAAQAPSFQRTWADLPAFLQQLQPTLQKLGAAADAQDPVLANLNASAANLNRFFTDLVPFANSSRVSLTCGENGQPACPTGGLSLGSASATGISAVKAATPTVAALNRFTGPTDPNNPSQACPAGASQQLVICTPELAKNLGIVLQDLNTQNRAVEADKRSPGGKGYSGLQALLQYVFNQAVAVNTFTQFGHQLTVDGFASQNCSPYATQATLASNLKAFESGQNPDNPRACYAWLGPNQQGINEPDPSNPGACVPDPGGSPPGEPGPSSGGACKMSSDVSASNASSASANAAQPNTAASAASDSGGSSGPAPATSSGGGSSGGGSSGTPSSSSGAPSSSSSGAPSSSSGGGQTQQLLNYLLAP